MARARPRCSGSLRRSSGPRAARPGWRVTIVRRRPSASARTWGCLRAGKWLDGHLGGFKAAGGAILMTTHSFGRGLGVADRIAILTAGRLAFDAPLHGLTPDDVRRLYELHAENGG